MIDLCNDNEILFHLPYNEDDIKFLDSLDVPFLKAASMHIAEPRFLQQMAETGRPLVISTGMANWNEIYEAVDAIRATGNNDFVLLQCTTNYPSLIQDVNLRVMPAMRDRYNCLVGYSDHTQSHLACLGSIAMGACVIEKHLTLKREMDGPDHSTSETPQQFSELVALVRQMKLFSVLR